MMEISKCYVCKTTFETRIKVLDVIQRKLGFYSSERLAHDFTQFDCNIVNAKQISSRPRSHTSTAAAILLTWPKLVCNVHHIVTVVIGRYCALQHYLIQQQRNTFQRSSFINECPRLSFAALLQILGKVDLRQMKNSPRPARPLFAECQRQHSSRCPSSSRS